MKNFIEWLNERLEQLGMSQAELAREVNVSPATISRLLSGETQPRDQVITDIAKAINESPEKIFRMLGRLPSAPMTEQIEQDLIYNFRSLSTLHKQFILDILRGLQGKPSNGLVIQPLPAVEGPAINKNEKIVQEPGAIIEALEQLDDFERGLVYDYIQWRLWEQQHRRDSDGERKQAMREGVRHSISQIDLYLGVGDLSPQERQRLIADLQRLAQKVEEGMSGE